MTPDPRVAVVVITHNRADELAHTLSRLAELPEAPPVVVVDNGCTDGTAELVRTRFPAVELLTPGRNVGAAGRNLGVARVDTRYVAFCDDDTWWEPGALAQAADAMDAHPRLAVVTGHIVVEPAGTEDPICVDLRQSPLPHPPGLPGYPLMSFLAGASVVRRSAFLAAGGFSPRWQIGGEEELLAADLAVLGWAMAHLPEVVVHHRASRQRDPHLRRRQGIRNTLWFAWTRRPLRSALRRTARLACEVPRDTVSARAFAEALAGASWVVRERRVVPPDVERNLALLEEPQRRSAARRYVS